VKAQHLERNVGFLVDELRVTTRPEAEERVYFVSAREALVSRSSHAAGTPTPTSQLLEGYQGRLFEFASFEAKFQVSRWCFNGVVE
jgi:mitofusin